MSATPVDAPAAPSSIEPTKAVPRFTPRKLPLPKSVHRQVLWIYAIPIPTVHLLACLAFIPYYFTWTGLIVAIIGIHVFGDLGINLCYHRLLAHRSFKTSRWFERFLVLFALCSLEDTPAKWVATHRIHHKESDEEDDPHSPFVNFFWSHMGWLFVYNSGTRSISAFQRFARDILDDGFYMALEKSPIAPLIYLLHALLYFVIGLAIGWAYGGYSEGLRLGSSLLVWGVFVRTVAVWHITWSVNSLTHLFGYRLNETTDGSRNNWFVAALSAGEGWHNNHHYDQSSASVQLRWWEIDLTYYTILTFRALGLAWDVIPPRHKRQAARNTTA